MKRDTIENIFNFLQEKEGKLPYKWNLIKEFENHLGNIQYRYEGDLDFSNSIIKKLPNNLYVDGDLILYACKQLTKLPDKLHVTNGLFLVGSIIAKLPNNLYVEDDLSITDCLNLTKLPNKLRVDGALYLRATPLAYNYRDEEIRKIVASTGGQIKGSIIR